MSVAYLQPFFDPLRLQFASEYGTICDMEYFNTSFQIVMPLVLMMATGFLLRKVGVVTEDALRVVNRIVYYVGIPTLVFYSVVTDRTPARWQYALWVAGTVLLAFILAMLLARVLTKDPAKRGTIAQASYRSNDGIFGLAVATALSGEGNTGTMAFTLVISAALFGITGVLCYELNRGGKIKIGKVLLNTIKNPILIAAAYLLGGIRGAELASLFIVFSSPVAMSCMPMASELGGDVKLAGELIAVTTVLSLLTVFLYLTFFGGILI